MKRFRAPPRQACRNGWIATAGLALLTLLISLLIDGSFNGTHEQRSAPWSALPVIAGVLVLNARQESLVAFLFLALELQVELVQQNQGLDGSIGALLPRRLLFLAVCIWAARSTDHLRQQRRQMEANQDALGAKLAQSLQASALAHELRQPLSQLLLQTRLLQHRLEQQSPANPGLQQAIAELQGSSQQINRLIEAIGSLLRTETPAPEPVDLVAVLRSCLRRIEPGLQAAGVGLLLSGVEQPRLVEGQPQQLEIACCNLLTNALQALEQQPQPRQLAITLVGTDEQVELLVADSGPGLPSTNLRDLLMNSSKPQGMGVGLLTVQSIASRHGGVLQLGRCDRLGGAQLRLRLPKASLHPS